MRPTYNLKYITIKIKRPTKPQIKLFEVIKNKFPDENVIMEYPIKFQNGCRALIDIAIPDLKLGWEYDEPAFHGGFRGDKDRDLQRHELIEARGWKITHYSNISDFKK